MVHRESDVRRGETSSGPVTIVVNLDLRQQHEVVRQVTALCLAAVGLCIVVGGSLLVIVGLLHSVGGLLSGIDWAWDYCAKLELFGSQMEWVAVTELAPVRRSCN